MATSPIVQAQRLARQGRGGDTTIAHLTPGELVVPPTVLAQMGTAEQLRRGFAAAGLDMGRYTVGGSDDSRNPATGMREYRGGGAEGTGDPGPGGGGNEGPGPEDPSEGFSGEGGLADSPSRGGPSAPDATGDGEDAFAMFDDPQMQPHVDREALDEALGYADIAGSAAEKGLKQKEEMEPTFTDALLALGKPLGFIGLLGKQHEMNKALDATAEEFGITRDQLDVAMGDFGHTPSDMEGGEGPEDTLPGDAGTPQTEPEDAGPTTPEEVFADITPWEGVPDVTQAALPTGWLQDTQSQILAAHQSAVRLGAV